MCADKSEETEIAVDPMTRNPTAAWAKICESQQVIQVDLKPPQAGVAPNRARVVCISDTHGLTHYNEMPDGDILIHAGDFTCYGDRVEVDKFNRWLGTLPHKYKIVIAGNHELSFDPAKNSKSASIDAKALLTNCTYLEDEFIEVWGIKIYGSPWQPVFGNWAFNLPRGHACLEKWNLIPEGVDILVTHGPPLGHGDLCCSGVRAGCVELLATVQKRVKPKYHIFGHIHEGHGVTSDGYTTFVNASICDIRYNPINKPIVFDMTLKTGVEKN